MYILQSILVLCALYAAKFTMPQNPTIQLSIKHLEGKKGTLYIAFFASEASFKAEKNPEYRIIEPVEKLHNFTTKLSHVSPGKYMVAVFLDENANKKLDRNMFGYPTEKFGFAGKKHPFFKSPKYHDLAIDMSHTAAKVIEVDLN